MTKDTLEKMARFACEWAGEDPGDSLEGKGGNFRWEEARDTLVKPMLALRTKDDARTDALQEALEMIANHVRDGEYSFEVEYFGCKQIAREALALLDRPAPAEEGVDHRRAHLDKLRADIKPSDRGAVTPTTQPTPAPDSIEQKRETAARAMEGDCDNPLRVREANAIREGLRDYTLVSPTPDAVEAELRDAMIEWSGTVGSNPYDPAIEATLFSSILAKHGLAIAALGDKQ